MEFTEFTKDFERAIDKNIYEIIKPKSKADREKYFWVEVIGTCIGTGICHYEFTRDENTRDKEEFVINLEIHFEFETKWDSGFADRIKSVGRLLGKPIKDLPAKGNEQVGIVYEHFSNTDSMLVENAVATLETMDVAFRKEFPEFMSKVTTELAKRIFP